MKKRFFSLGMYRESMRRMLRAGIILGVVLLLAAVMVPIGIKLNTINTDACTEGMLCTTEQSKTVDTALSLPLLPLVSTVAAPLLAWIAFSFLRRRNTSDFFHALPLTRSCAYVSVLAALLSWLVLLTFIPAMVAYLTVQFLPGLVSVFSATMLYALSIFVSAIQVASIVVFAQTLTGTFFSSLIVGGMLLFGPRLLLFSVTQSLDSAIQVSAFGQAPFFAPEYNLGVMTYVAQTLFSLIFTNASSILTQVTLGQYLYASGLFCIYAILGGVFFCRRRSETAEHAASGHHAQSLFRVLVLCAISLPVSAFVFEFLFRQNDMAEGWWFIVCYVIAAVAYFAYELITTKRFYNLLRALPGFFIGIVLNALLVGLMYLTASHVLSVQPLPQEVQSVRLVSQGGGNQFEDYVAEQTEQIAITDQDCCNLLARLLSEQSKEVWENRTDLQTRLSSGTLYETYSFELQTTRGTYLRKIRIPQGNGGTDVLIAAMQREAAYRTAWQTLPDYITGGLSYSVFYEDEGILSEQVLREACQMMRQEVLELPFADWYATVHSLDSFFTLRFETMLAGKTYTIELPVSQELTPKTWGFLQEELYAVKADAAAELLQLLGTQDGTCGCLTDIQVCFPDTMTIYKWIVDKDSYSYGTIYSDQEIWEGLSLAESDFLLGSFMENRVPEQGKAYIYCTYCSDAVFPKDDPIISKLPPKLQNRSSISFLFAAPFLTEEQYLQIYEQVSNN